MLVLVIIGVWTSLTPEVFISAFISIFPIFFRLLAAVVSLLSRGSNELTAPVKNRLIESPIFLKPFITPGKDSIRSFKPPIDWSIAKLPVNLVIVLSKFSEPVPSKANVLARVVKPAVSPELNFWRFSNLCCVVLLATWRFWFILANSFCLIANSLLTSLYLFELIVNPFNSSESWLISLFNWFIDLSESPVWIVIFLIISVAILINLFCKYNNIFYSSFPLQHIVSLLRGE